MALDNIGQKSDKYGRDLVYVWVDKQLVQSTLVSEGLAKVAYVSPPNTRYLDILEANQEQAQSNNLGIWE
ncbi:hypothetical protein CJ206_00310 [Dolosicoccus paucivorans]|nr:hypothetical protein CJ206_00310 [Dolosicoccus paucivorans]